MVKSMFQALCTATSDFNSFGLLFPESFHLWQFSACLSFLPSVVIFLKAVRVNSSGCVGHESGETSRYNFSDFTHFSSSKQRFQRSEGQVHVCSSSSAEKHLSRITCVCGVPCRKITCSISNIQIP